MLVAVTPGALLSPPLEPQAATTTATARARAPAIAIARALWTGALMSAPPYLGVEWTRVAPAPMAWLFGPLSCCTCLTSARGASTRDGDDPAQRALYPRRPREHRDYQHDPVDRQRKVRGHLLRQREGVREVFGPARQQHEHGRAPDRADLRAEAAERDRRQQRQREAQLEGSRRRQLQHDRQQAAGE